MFTHFSSMRSFRSKCRILTGSVLRLTAVSWYMPLARCENEALEPFVEMVPRNRLPIVPIDVSTQTLAHLHLGCVRPSVHWSGRGGSQRGGGYNYDSTSIRRAFDCSSEVIRVLGDVAASRSHADLLTYLFTPQRSSARTYIGRLS